MRAGVFPVIAVLWAVAVLCTFSIFIAAPFVGRLMGQQEFESWTTERCDGQESYSKKNSFVGIKPSL